MTNLFFKPMLWGLLSLFVLASCSSNQAIYTLYPDLSAVQDNNQVALEEVSQRLNQYSQLLLDNPEAAPTVAKNLKELQNEVDEQREENQQSRDIKDIIDNIRGATARLKPCPPDCPTGPPCQGAGKCIEIRLERDQLILLLPALFEKHTFSLESAEGALIAKPTKIKALPGGQVRVEMKMLQPDYQGGAAFYARASDGTQLPDFFTGFDFQPPQ